MVTKRHITIPQLAKMLGISRIAVYRKVKNGQIPATRIGRIYVISDEQIAAILGRKVSNRGKRQVDAAVKKTIREYGDLLKRLSRE